jgi:metallo-beta-lactamase family protein
MTDLEIAFHGAAGTVTGSRHLLTAGTTRVLLDAGLFQGLKELRQRNWSHPGFDAASLDHVVLSHTHIDHVGYLPRLAPRCPVHCTPAAYELTRLMLLDAAKIQEEDAARANRKGYSKHRPALPLFTTEDARAALELRRKERYGAWFGLGDGVRARFHNAGHILGSAFVELRVSRGGGEVGIVFSGDLGRYGAPLHRDPDPLPEHDLLIVEATYGDRLHSRQPIDEQVTEPVGRTLEEGGTVLVPAFAVGRSQVVSLLLRRLMDEGAIPEAPIHLDSPMAVEATAIYDRFLDGRNVDDEHFADGRQRLLPPQVELHDTVADSKRLNSLPGPRVVISASGMLTGGRVLHHLRRLAPDPRNLLLLVGYQPAGTRGRALLDGARELKAYGSQFPVRCRVLSVDGLSGHADRDELLRWVGTAPRPPAVACVVHGEGPALRSMARHLAERYGTLALVPSLGETVDVPALLDRAAQRPA